MITCSWGENIRKPKEIYDYSLSYLFDYMQYSDKLEDMCNYIRNTKKTEEKRKKVKGSLPYVITCTLNNPERNTKNLKESNLMILDVDKISSEKLINLKNRLRKEPFVHFVFVSPSGNGLKIGMTFNKIITDPAVFTHNYKTYANQFSKVYRVPIDNTHDVVRACFVSFDDDFYYNPESIPLNVLYPKPEVKKEFKVEVSQDETIEKARQLCQQCNSILSYDDWYKCGAALASLGHIGEDLFVLLSTGNGSKDNINSIRSKYRSIERLDRIGIGSFFEIMKRNGVFNINT